MEDNFGIKEHSVLDKPFLYVGNDLDRILRFILSGNAIARQIYESTHSESPETSFLNYENLSYETVQRLISRSQQVVDGTEKIRAQPSLANLHSIETGLNPLEYSAILIHEGSNEVSVVKYFMSLIGGPPIAYLSTCSEADVQAKHPDLYQIVIGSVKTVDIKPEDAEITFIHIPPEIENGHGLCFRYSLADFFGKVYGVEIVWPADCGAHCSLNGRRGEVVTAPEEEPKGSHYHASGRYSLVHRLFHPLERTV